MTQRDVTRGHPVYVGSRGALEAVRRGDQEVVVTPIALPDGRRAYRVRLLHPRRTAAQRPAQPAGRIVSPWVSRHGYRGRGFAVAAQVVLAGLCWAVWVVLGWFGMQLADVGGTLLIVALVLALVVGGGGGCAIVVTVRHRH